jgi:hypothetical protein
MPERRQAHRREPIEVEVSTGTVWVARPLPWTTRNDFGDAIVKANADAVNAAVKLYVEDEGGINMPQIELALTQKIRDWKPLFDIAYPGYDPEDLGKLFFEDCIDLALAAMEVNSLSQLNHLVDPNSPTPMLPGGADTSGAIETTNGAKNGSSPDSDSTASTEMPPSISPTPS